MLTCAYLAAVFLCLDALREGHHELADGFRLRALGTAAVTGLVGLAGLFVLRADAPQLADGLFGRALPVVALSVLAGLASIVLLVLRRYAVARGRRRRSPSPRSSSAGPRPSTPTCCRRTSRSTDAAAGEATLVAMLVSLIIGSCVLVPALVYLYRLFQRAERITP